MANFLAFGFLKMRFLQVVLLCTLCVAQLNARTGLPKDNSLDDTSSDVASNTRAHTYNDEELIINDDYAELLFYDNTLPLEGLESHVRLKRDNSLQVKDRLRVMTFSVQNFGSNRGDMAKVRTQIVNNGRAL